MTSPSEAKTVIYSINI